MVYSSILLKQCSKIFHLISIEEDLHELEVWKLKYEKLVDKSNEIEKDKSKAIVLPSAPDESEL
jgi:hypothetical protein